MGETGLAVSRTRLLISSATAPTATAMSRMRTMLLCLLLPPFGSVHAQSNVPSVQAQADPPTLDTVLVTGEQPGPGLWKVTGGDHVLWILGTQLPLPKKMTWRAQEVEKTIAQSQEVLADAAVKVDIGFFRMLTLLPSLLSAKKNEQGAKLQDVLPAELYARWLAL